MHSAALVFTYDNREAAALVEAAISREVGEIDGERASASVGLDGRDVRVDVDADDLVALRAGLNTWGTLVEVAERMVDAGSR